MRCPPAFALAVLIGVALAVCSAAQQKEAIRIELEPDVRQEAADVRYFLTVWKQPAWRIAPSQATGASAQTLGSGVG